MRKRAKGLLLGAVPVLLFAAGVGLGLALWSRLELPFSNPWEVQGPLVDLRLNPANSVVRFLALIGLQAAELLTYRAEPSVWLAH